MRRFIPPPNPIVRSVFPLLVFFLAAMFSGIWEKLTFLAPFHILMLVGGVVLMLVGLAGRLPVVLETPIAKYLAIFTAWLIVCIPFAVWRGGSFFIFLNLWTRAALAFLLVAGCILTIDQCKTIFKTIGYSVGVLAILALALREVDKSGRLGLIGTRYENANDFGWNLVFALPFLGLLLLRGNWRQKFIALFFSVPILLALVKTGSRASMVGFGVLLIVGFIEAPRALKIKLTIGIPIFVAVLIAVTPAEMRSRYITFFGTGANYSAGAYQSSEERLEATAVGSAENRWELLKDAFRLTLTHPVFGVGPGNFMTAQNDLAVARGERGKWRETHNTYAQISSEMGIPGLIIYVLFLYHCLKPLNWIVRSRYPGKDWDDLRALAKTLRATFIVVLTVMLFGSFAYDANVPIIAGLACALSLIAQRQLAFLTASRQATPTPAVEAEPALEPAWTR